jgi:tetratricopeptide (TPR) repeat protein
MSGTPERVGTPDGAPSAISRGTDELDALRRATRVDPQSAAAWHALACYLLAIGDSAAADDAFARALRAATSHPELLEPATALCEGRFAVAERQLRDFLQRHPDDVAAIRLVAEIAMRLGRFDDAEQLLARCVASSPSSSAVRHSHALALQRQSRTAEALCEIDIALRAEPHNPGYRTSRAGMLSRLGNIDEAIGIYANVLASYPAKARAWLSYGHLLRTAGRHGDSVTAYRRSIELAPNFGEAYWSLADLKTFLFSQSDVAAMRVQLARPGLENEDRLNIDFALAKALEDTGDYAASFQHYEAGNRLKRAAIHYSADENSDYLRRSREMFTQAFLDERLGSGCQAPDPIFIVGLPRSGSTLVEQVLSSHPLVEGTGELPNLIAMISALSGKRGSSDQAYPELVATLGREDLRAMGERYIAETRAQRRTSAPYFIDKMPNNFHHVGVIHLILPNARIIDTRRHPLGCCFSNYKQNFASGQAFTYSLEDIGRYYRDYVEFMAHFDSVRPGRVHRVTYEAMVEDTEAEVRRLLDYCGLPFDAACLRFYETERAVRTASSEQVRRPIYRDGVDQWRHFEPWLGPLKQALGPVLDAYPSAP